MEEYHILCVNVMNIKEKRVSFNKTLKKSAKSALKGNWGPSIIISVIIVVLELVVAIGETALIALFDNFGITHFLHKNIFVHVDFSAETAVELFVALLCTLISFSFIAPLLVGEIRWYCKVFDNSHVKIRELFHFYKTPRLYFKSVFVMLSIFLQRLWWAILIFIVPITAFALSSVLIEGETVISQGFGIVALVIGTGFLGIGIVFFLKIYLDFSLASHVLAEDETIKVSKAIKISKNTMHKNEVKLLVLKLTFLPLELVEIFFFPLFFIMPYYHATHVAFARHFLKEHNPIK